MAKDIPGGYEKAENQEFEDSDEIRRFLRNYCPKCIEMHPKLSKSGERCYINGKLKEALEDGGPEEGFSPWADAFIALIPSGMALGRKVHCFDLIKYKK